LVLSDDQDNDPLDRFRGFASEDLKWSPSQIGLDLLVYFADEEESES